MPSVRKTQGTAKNPQQPAEPAPAPTFVARRKNLKWLVLAAALLSAWLMFLAVMAFRG